MQEIIQNCPVCESASISDYLQCKDHFLSGETFTLSKCQHCSFVFTNPRPKTQELPRYYKSDSYISHTNKSDSLINYIYKYVRRFTIAGKVKLANSITDTKRILDFGCGTGDFISACKENGWSIHGVEPDDKAREIAAKTTNSNIASSLSEIDESDNLGLITLWHVLEHIPDLNSTLETLIQKLSNDGKLLIAVPNQKSYDARYYNSFWAAYDVPRHLYHFNTETMDLLLNKHGLKIYRKIPMKLDSFYVSLLSEKYMGNSLKYINSIINGYKSNSYAKKNSNNFSSLIFIAGK